MALTPTRQRNAVSQGVALGLLLNGCDELPSNKTAVDLAFEGAWRDWAHRDLFPQVKTDIAKGLDAWNVITRADEAKRVLGPHWTQDGYRWVVTTRDADWSVDDPDDLDHAVNMIGADVSAEAWSELAQEFLRRVHR